MSHDINHFVMIFIARKTVPKTTFPSFLQYLKYILELMDKRNRLYQVDKKKIYLDAFLPMNIPLPKFSLKGTRTPMSINHIIVIKRKIVYKHGPIQAVYILMLRSKKY